VSKEFDSNDFYVHPAFTDQSLSDSGLKNNFGQPSVVFRVPFHLARGAGIHAAAQDIAGYGDWDGSGGTLHPADKTITDAPGSGRGRLLSLPVPGVTMGMMARVYLSSDEVPVPVPDAGPDAAPGDAGISDGAVADTASSCAAQTPSRIRDLSVPPDGIEAEHALIRFIEPDGAAFAAVERYDVRVWEGGDSNPAAFASGTPAPQLLPLAPGGSLAVRIADLKGQRQYTVGVKPVGRCLDGEISTVGFSTAARKFSQLSGCFIATAAFGSPQAAGVAALRRVRDAARRSSLLAGAAAALYERSSPPLADLLRGTPAGRALVRQALAPLIEAAQALSPTR
jgi:hypothetical protein